MSSLSEDVFGSVPPNGDVALDADVLLEVFNSSKPTLLAADFGVNRSGFSLTQRN